METRQPQFNVARRNTPHTHSISIDSFKQHQDRARHVSIPANSVVVQGILVRKWSGGQDTKGILLQDWLMDCCADFPDFDTVCENLHEFDIYEAEDVRQLLLSDPSGQVLETVGLEGPDFETHRQIIVEAFQLLSAGSTESESVSLTSPRTTAPSMRARTPSSSSTVTTTTPTNHSSTMSRRTGVNSSSNNINDGAHSRVHCSSPA
eukprot:c12788_g1_i2.p1 GENE.c12788_g1_i2~~c12788_g1_i2.p1  ORF type:complete len:206 (-),score=43.38 c12788_g1_i2:358-975(-)